MVISRISQRMIAGKTIFSSILSVNRLPIPELISKVNNIVIMLYMEPRRLEKWEEPIFERYGNKCVQPNEIKDRGRDYILCFSFWDINELVEIDPKPGAIYLYSSSEAFDEEQKFDTVRLRNWLNLLGMKPVGVPDIVTGKVPEEEKGSVST